MHAVGPDELAAAVARMAELRRRTRQILWSVRSHLERRSYSFGVWKWIGLPWTLRRLIGLPGAALRALSLSGRDVLDAHGVSRIRQLIQMVTLSLRWGLDAGEYYEYALYRQDRVHLAPLFLSDPTNGQVLVAAIGPRDPQRTKTEFWERCLEAGLPTIPILAECGGVGDDPVLHDADSPAWNGDLFTKPDSSGQANGVRMWVRQDDGEWHDGDMVARTREELLSALVASDEHSGWIVQPRLLTHPDLEDLTTGALCTVRIVTYRDPGSGRTEILFAALKMPCGGVGDNLSLGGIPACVDLESGCLGPGYPQAPRGQILTVTDHPVTGARIEGRRVPNWEETAALARRVHEEAFPENSTGGWDIAVTDPGPVLVEANDLWGGCGLMQMDHDLPIGLTGYPTVMLKYLKAAAARRALQQRF